VHAAVLRFVLLSAQLALVLAALMVSLQEKIKVLHSSRFFTLQEIFHEECDSLATYILSSQIIFGLLVDAHVCPTRAIRLKLTLSSIIMPRITSRHFSDKTSSPSWSGANLIGLLRSPSS
jgi:membrane-anchored glycerophosphoryl diester phosphodiesterase (GDPDase)